MLQVHTAKIAMHEAGAPSPLVNFLATQALAGRNNGDIDHFLVQMELAAGGDQATSALNC